MCYNVLKERLVSISRFRQSTGIMTPQDLFSVAANSNSIDRKRLDEQTEVFVSRVNKVRAIHCDAMWQRIRSESLECEVPEADNPVHEEGESRRQWLGYSSKGAQQQAEERYRREKLSQQQGKGISIEEVGGYQDLAIETTDSAIERQLNDKFEQEMQDDSEYDNPPSLGGRERDARATEEAKEGVAWKAYWAND